MGMYQITFNSKEIMSTSTYEADSVGEAIDAACDEEEEEGGSPEKIEVTIVGG